jgi:hypothetical protein
MADPRRERGRLDLMVSAAGVTRTRFRAIAGVSARGYKALDTGDPTGIAIGTLLKVAAALGVPAVEVLPLLGTTPKSGLSKAMAARRQIERAAAEQVWRKPRPKAGRHGRYSAPDGA